MQWAGNRPLERKRLYGILQDVHRILPQIIEERGSCEHGNRRSIIRLLVILMGETDGKQFPYYLPRSFDEGGSAAAKLRPSHSGGTGTFSGELLIGPFDLPS